MREAKALIESRYPGDVAHAIARALQADNISTKDASITTRRSGNLVITRVHASSIEKLLPVVDDVLLCHSLCEKVLKLATGDTAKPAYSALT